MTWLVYLVFVGMALMGALAIALARGTSRIDAVEIGTDDDGLEAAHDEANRW